jgi:hypothetical protein
MEGAMGRPKRCFAAAAAAIALLLASPAAWPGSGAATGPSGRSARSHLDFAIAIPAVMRLHATGQPAVLAVSAEDVSRGYVDVDRVRIEVTANLRGLKRLVASVTAGFAQKVRITGLPEELLASPEASTILGGRAGGVVDRRYDVRVRIHLAPGAGPGLYPWPVRLSLEAA